MNKILILEKIFLQMGLKDTYIFCEFLHHCVQVTPEFRSKHQSYLA